MPQSICIFWFRRDLRLEDNAGLYHALLSGYPVLPVFIYDADILRDLEDKKDRRVCFIRDSLEVLQGALLDIGSTLYTLYGSPVDCFERLVREYDIAGVYTNEDYEPYARQRDERVADLLNRKRISFHTYKDQVIFSKDEILKEDCTPYTVFTPYSRKWKQRLNDFYLASYPSERYSGNFLKRPPVPLPALHTIGFEEIGYEIPEPVFPRAVAVNYHETRDFPGIEGATKLSVHLRFGTVSIRRMVAHALELNEKLVDEFIWREFFQCILWHFPETVSRSFRAVYDNIEWRNNEREFGLWCNGQTGYPIVDAGMRQLMETGWMHNRVRMITAGFLCKHLLIDWRWGEAWFAGKLLDYDLAQNVGNWQWAAGSGVDAAPYFRIFNPQVQQQKFDRDGSYVRKWVPEAGTTDYPRPVIEHSAARQRCLEVYGKGLGKGNNSFQ